MTKEATTGTTADLATTCWTCEPLKQYIALTEGFADTLSATLVEPIGMLFASLAMLWIVLAGIKLPFKMTSLEEVVKDLVYIAITGMLLGAGSTGLIANVYRASLEVMGGAASAVFSIAGTAQTSTGESGLVALAANGEQAMAKVFQAAQAIAGAGSLYSLQLYVYALILIVPYFLLIVAYSSQVVVSIFRVVMVAVFAPFLFMGFAFNWGRGMAVSGAKTLLASILVLFASTASLALCVYGVNTLSVDPTKLTGDEINNFASIHNPAFLAILFLGWAGTALMAEGTSIANSIAGTALTNAAAGIMTAGISGSALALGKMGGNAVKAGLMSEAGVGGAALKGMKWAGDHAGHGLGYGGAAVAHNAAQLLDRFKNINKPGGGA